MPIRYLTIFLLVKRKIENYLAGELIMPSLSIYIPSFTNPIIFIEHCVPGPIPGNENSMTNFCPSGKRESGFMSLQPCLSSSTWNNVRRNSKVEKSKMDR